VTASLTAPPLSHFVEIAHERPAEPYRSLAAFRFADSEILVARDDDVERLVRFVTMYRGVLLYGLSGVGKSSVVNAGLLPRIIDEGFWPHRVRVQPPRVGKAFVVEPTPCSDQDSEAFLPSAFGGDPSARLVMDVDEFDAAVSAIAKDSPILLVFDQFEELVTLFGRAGDGNDTAGKIIALLIDLLRRESLRVKLLFVFREDYLASLKPLLEAQPELSHQYLRLEPPPLTDATEIIRAPFEKFPREYPRELSSDLAEQIKVELGARSVRDELNLSELQIVCSRLWKANDPELPVHLQEDPEVLLERRGVGGLLEDHLDEALKQLPTAVQDAAMAVLVNMITSSGTRNVVSAEDLVVRAREEQPDLSPDTLEDAIQRLERDTGLIRRERRHDIELYELVSEFLIPRISVKRRELEREQERAKARRKLLIFSSITAVAAVVLAVLIYLTFRFYDAEQSAKRAKAQATYSGLQSTAQAVAASRPDISVLLSLAGYLHLPTTVKPVMALSTLLAYEEGYTQETSRSGELAILGGHTDTVTSVAFDPRDANVLASASGDGTIRLWDVRAHSGSVLAAGRRAVFSLAFSPTGRVVASGNSDGTVRLYDVSKRRAAGEALPALGASVFRVAFSPDGHELAAASISGHISIWRVANGLPVGPPLAELTDRTLRSIAFSPDSRTLAAVGNNGTVRLWPATGGAQLASWPLRSPLYAVAFRPHTSEVAAGGLSGQVWLWNTASRNRPVPVAGGAAIDDLAFSPDGDRIGAALADGSARITVLAGTGASAVLHGHTGIVTTLAFSPNGETVATGSADRTVRLWTLTPHQAFGYALPDAPARSVSAVAFSRDGSELASGFAPTKPAHGRPSTSPPGVWLWRGDPTRVHPKLLATPSGVRSVAFSADGRLLASATQGGVFQLWNTVSGQLVAQHIFRRDPLYSVAFSPNDALIAIGSDDGILRLYHTAGGAVSPLPTPRGVPIYSVAFSPDGRLLASAGDDRMVRLWRLDDGVEIGTLTGDTDAVFSVAFSPDGRTLASASADETVRLWDVAQHTQIRAPLTGFHAYARSVAFSRDGRTLAASSKDGTIRLWDVASQIAIGQPLSASTMSVESVAFNPAGVLASGGLDGATRLWPAVVLPANPRRLEATACKIVSGLNREQWDQYAAGLLPYKPLCAAGK